MTLRVLLALLGPLLLGRVTVGIPTPIPGAGHATTAHVQMVAGETNLYHPPEPC
ncbi:MAG: hypothetical protein NVS2B16_37600 [Chloroflexota bacterium]